jgi:L-asparaginase
VAASPLARGTGTLVVMNDEIHLGRFVRKAHATSPATFESRPLGPIGWVAEDHVRMPLVPRVRPRRFVLPVGASVPQVALLKMSLGDSPALIEHIDATAFAGAVIETYGAGHTSQRVLDALAALAKRMPTIFASRTGAGEVHTSTCDFPGSELRLIERGLIPAGALDGLKARLLLSLVLADGLDAQSLRDEFTAAVS